MERFLKRVNEEIAEAPIERCYHCRKCTVGCPLNFAMEYSPDAIIRMIQLDKKEQVLTSSTIWLCVSCETCFTRCPNEVNIARMMDVLRQMAVDEGYGVKEKDILAFHQTFLSSIKRRGRINEPLLLARYKLKTRELFADISLGLKLFFKGKLPLFTKKTKGKEELKAIFYKTVKRKQG